MKKFLLFGILIFKINPVLAEYQLCEILYGKKDLDQKQKPSLNCYQIGVEFNKNNQPEEHKPIYTCCKAMK